MEFLKAASIRHLPRWQSALARPKWWTSSCCRSQRVIASARFASQPSRPATSTSTPGKPYYVTTPIFYVNAAPHVGHMYSMVLADVLKRWQILKGNRAIMVTGTDEHGMKVQQAAAKQDMHPKQFCDETAEQFKELAHAAGVEYDRFIRTTDEDHIQAVEHFWFCLLQEKGFIYESKHEGWYSISDECFYPESQLERRMDAFTGEVFMASAETKNKVEWVEEKNYHFRMTALKDKLLKFYKENPEWVVPKARMEDVIDWVENHLTDLSISRPVNRLTWGIRVPGDASQTIYVWVDALINYLTMAGYPNWTPGREHEGGWPADVHIIGKDIVRFHCVYWPALLLALDLPMPRRILTHAHWTLNRQKMSKSIGNVVNPLYAISNYGVDTMRFYLMFEGGLIQDADYSNDILFVKYKKYLQGGLGNLLGRVTRSKVWNLRELVIKASDDENPQLGSLEAPVQEAFSKLEGALAGSGLRATVEKEMETLYPVGAIREIVEIGSQTNLFMSQTQPWALVKSENPTGHAVAHRALYLAAESLRICGILLQPFLPTKSAQLLDSLGVAKDRRTMADAELGADFSYGMPIVDVGRCREDSLFPPLYENKDFIFKKQIRQDKQGNKISFQKDLQEAIQKLEGVEEDEKV